MPMKTLVRACVSLPLLWLSVLSPVQLVHAASVPAPSDLEQSDSYGAIPVGDLVGSGPWVFRFLVTGQAGEALTPEVELRPVSEPFDQPNFTGEAVVATGAPQWLAVETNAALATSGYHWRARVVGALGPSPWAVFGDNEDSVDPPQRFADADFFVVPEPLPIDPQPSVGFESMVQIGQLPLIVPGASTHQVSSFDRTEGNTDGGSTQPGLESYFYREGSAEVVLEADGPGQITRIWFAESGDPAFLTTQLQFFFDGAPAPGYEITVADLVSGGRPPFVAPLVLNADRSSGGLISYVPIPFRAGVKVRFVGPHAHYQITYQLFDQDTQVRTFTGTEDYTLARHLWQHAGEDPKPARGNQTATAHSSLAPGQTWELPALQGCGVLQSLKLHVPQLRPSIVGTPPLDDQVRAHRQGASQFELTPQAAQRPTRLRIRRGCYQAPQTALVSLDGQLLGTWTHSQGNDRYGWCEDTYELPAPLIHAGVPVQVHIASSHPDNAWEEARYWLEQQVDGAWAAVDEIDVGDSASELAHGYAISGQTAAGWRTYTYRPVLSSQPASEALLAGLRLQITADQGETPQVDAPLGAFFGSAVGLANLASLLVGMDPATQSLYSYWPIPFDSELRISLVNASPIAVQQISLDLAYARRCYPLPGQATGYFHVFESLSRPTTADLDHPLIAADGAGRIVGLHLLVHSGNEGLIEGDERWHVDGGATPQVRGTGTEDVFNGGWYYNRGRVITPVHGVNSTRLEGWIDQYRWYIADAIVFGAHLRGGIEHGATNDLDADYSSWTYAYLAPQAGVLHSDSVDFADAQSMSDHGVVLAGLAEPLVLAAQFEGDDDSVITAGGLRLHPGSVVTVTLAVDPAASQVILRRRYDQGVDKERLRVTVDGLLVGDWLDGGRNIARRWRESVFLLPPSLTQDRQHLTLRFEPVAWSGSHTASFAQLAALSLYARNYVSWLPLVLRR